MPVLRPVGTTLHRVQAPSSPPHDRWPLSRLHGKIVKRGIKVLKEEEAKGLDTRDHLSSYGVKTKHDDVNGMGMLVERPLRTLGRSVG